MARRRRRHGLGSWGSTHRGFPWYGVHPVWHILFIWPAIIWGVSTIIHGPRSLSGPKG